MASKFTVSVEGGKITLLDKSTKAWANYLLIFDTLAKRAKIKSAIIHFEAPDVRRGLLDAVPKDYLEKKYKIRIEEGMSAMPVNVALQIIRISRGFDIVVRIDAIDMIFFHTGKLEILSDMQLAANVAVLLKKMFPRAEMK